jgi:hypothetical protein
MSNFLKFKPEDFAGGFYQGDDHVKECERNAKAANKILHNKLLVEYWDLMDEPNWTEYIAGQFDLVEKWIEELEKEDE